MGSNKPLVLIYHQMPRLEKNKNINVMLTPQFYTLKRENLPVKYAYQAKRIAPSLFDGLLEGGSYEYYVTKEEDGWLFIAYDEEKIKDFLLSKDIDPARVSKLFFAQQSVEHFGDPVSMGEDDALSTIDGTVVVMPKVVLDETATLVPFDENFTPKSGVNFSSVQGSVFSSLQAGVLAVIFFIFAGLFAFEALRYEGDSISQSEEMESLLASYPSLQSSYTRNDTIEKYGTINKNEHKKREIIVVLSKMIFKGSTLSSLHLAEGSFKSVFVCDNSSTTKKLEALAKKEKFKAKTKGMSVEIEGAI